MAELEKSLLDYLYLNTHIKTSQDLDGLRLNTDNLKEQLDVAKLNDYLILFDSKALTARATLLLKYLELC